MNNTILYIIEVAGTMAFAISGIRLAAKRQFDLFGAYVVGLVSAIGGGTIRDVMLGVTPVWMEHPIYIIVTAISLLFVIVAGRHLPRFVRTFFLFDTIGLALFTTVGITKSLNAEFPMWVAITMGVVTGSFGGVVRDMLTGELPLIFRHDIYALASFLGGIFFAVLSHCGVDATTTSMFVIASIILMRLIAVKYHLQLPILNSSQRHGASDTTISLHRKPRNFDNE
ncbi:MAG: trimeric intracellular cation channel family protein [Rikenellaceae bacterium]